jgi:ankyrin repeat protein
MKLIINRKSLIAISAVFVLTLTIACCYISCEIYKIFMIEQLFSAVRSGDLTIVKSLIKKGLDVNIRDEDGISPIHYAVVLGHNHIAQLLIESGADVNTQSCDMEFTTLLYATCFTGNYELTRILIAAGANPNVASKNGWTPLMKAVLSNHEQIVAFLLEHGADPNIINREGINALHLAVKDKNKNIVKILLNNGASANISSHDLPPPLFFAIDNGDYMIIKLLLDFGADINIDYTPDSEQESRVPIDVAIINCDNKMVDYLISVGAGIKKTKIAIQDGREVSEVEVIADE